MDVLSLPSPTDPQMALRATIARLEGCGFGGGGPPPIRLGVAAIDRHLPWGGLARGVVHDIAGGHVLDNAATGFCAAVLARLCTEAAGPVLWVTRRGGFGEAPLYGHGLARFGLDPGRLLCARADSDKELLWAVEEGLRTPALAAVVAESGAVDLTASRRLQLAAEAHGVTAVLLRPARGTILPAAAATRWQVACAPSSPPDVARWHLDLDRCRGGTPQTWLVEWRDATGDLALAADPGDRPDLPRAARLAG
jgi:protein ImuA